MNRAWIEADEATAVRDAAARWRRAGAIDDATLAAIEDLFPARCRRFGPILRSVIFFFSSMAFFAACASAFAVIRPREAASFGLLFICFGVGLVALAEALLASDVFHESGAAAAASFWAVVSLVGGVVALAEPGSPERAALLVFGIAAGAFAAAAWRWGWPLFAGLAALSLFLSLVPLDSPRLLIVLAGTVLASASVPFLDRASLPHARRLSAHAVLLVSLAALYVAVNYFSCDRRLLEELFNRKEPPFASAAWRLVSPALTALFPVAVLAWGIRSRRRPVIAIGIVMAALSLLTLRRYVHVAPAWVVLIVSGTALAGAALWLERALRRSPGFTSEPLFENEARQRALGVVATVVALSPEAPRPPAEVGSRFTGGGGDSGGGGAGETY